MKRYTKNLIAFLLALVFIISSALPIFAVSKDSSGQPIKYSSEYNSGQRDVVCTTLNGTSAAGYYTGNNTYDNFDDMSQTELLSSLRTLMTSTHTKLTTYANCRDMAVRTDCENEAGAGISNDNDRTVLLLYTSYTAKRSQWNGWNREHVWPQSHGGNDDGLSVGESRGGSDLHHVRPSDAGVNSSRGNKPYGESGSNPEEKYGTNPAVGYLGGTYNSTYFEPKDNVKGDVARIVLYVWVRWGADWGAEYPNDPFNSVTEVFQSVDILLEWCALDPVDTWEMGRNEVVQSIQGNRNVFIDYPELAWLIFDREIPSDMVTPSGEAAKQSGCSHSNTKIVGLISATCIAAGYSGDIYCVDCEKTIATGMQTPATGNHTFTSWVVDTVHNVKTRSCTVCDKTETVDIYIEQCAHINTVTRNEASPTCANEGYTGDICCTSCGEIVTKGEKIPETGVHNYGETIVITAPTDLKDGIGEQACNNCSATNVVVIPAIYNDADVTIDILISNIESDQEKMILLLLLGASDKALYEELYQ